MITLGVISTILLILLILKHLKEMRNKTRQNDAIENRDENPGEATQEENAEVENFSSDGFQEQESSGDSLHDNFEFYMYRP